MEKGIVVPFPSKPTQSAEPFPKKSRKKRRPEAPNVIEIAGHLSRLDQSITALTAMRRALMLAYQQERKRMKTPNVPGILALGCVAGGALLHIVTTMTF